MCIPVLLLEGGFKRRKGLVIGRSTNPLYCGNSRGKIYENTSSVEHQPLKPNQTSTLAIILGRLIPLAPPKYLNSKFKIQNSSPSFVLAFLLSLVALYIFRVLVAFCFCFFFLPFLWGFFFFSFPPLQTPQENIFRFGRTRKQLKRLPLLVRGRQRLRASYLLEEGRNSNSSASTAPMPTAVFGLFLVEIVCE